MALSACQTIFCGYLLTAVDFNPNDSKALAPFRQTILAEVARLEKRRYAPGLSGQRLSYDDIEIGIYGGEVRVWPVSYA